jgi:hypothetical protein
MRTDRAIVVTKKIRPKCDRLHAQAETQGRFRFLPLKKPTPSCCDARTVIVDLSESNHEAFHTTADTSAQSAGAPRIGVNPVLHNFPDRRPMRCMDSNGT